MEAPHNLRWRAEVSVKTSVANASVGVLEVRAADVSEAKGKMTATALKALKLRLGARAEVVFTHIEWADTAVYGPDAPFVPYTGPIKRRG